MAREMLIDSDVLIEYLKGRSQAADYLESITQRPCTSVICVAELHSGARGAGEEQAIDRFLLAFDLLPVDAEIAVLAGRFSSKYNKSHGTGLADALIAATAATNGVQLITFNVRHYPMLSDVAAPYPRS